MNVSLILQASNLDDNADAYSVSRSLEAYLLWLFGYVMFNNSHGNTVDKGLIPFAQRIGDAAPNAAEL